MKVLVLNAGSSSQKSRLYDIGDTLPDLAPQPLWEANAEWSKDKGAATLKVSTAEGEQIQQEVSADSRPKLLDAMLKTLWSGKTQVLQHPSEITVVGQRVVHGGPDYQKSVRITPQVKETIQQLASFAPLHNPVNLEGINAIEHLLGDVPQIAVFDTAFHNTLRQEARMYPGPYEWFKQGIRRYGFHGTSYQYCTQRTAQLPGRDAATLRMILCHLGNGCSLAVIQDGKSIDTTMGFTPLEGLMMGSRSGTVDPSILTYLQREKGYQADQLDRILNKESGLQGISGLSSDMRQIQQAMREGNQRAALAFRLFVYRLRYFIGAMLATLGGLDVLAFTGGISEHSPEVRAAACEAFAFLNLHIDQEKNAASSVDTDIATPASSVRVLVVHTEEDWQIAKEWWLLEYERNIR